MSPAPEYLPATNKIAIEQEPKFFITSQDGATPQFGNFLNESVYSEVLTGLPILCADVLPYDPENGTFLIGKRQQEPQPAEWVFGGRMAAGISNVQSMQRNAKRELGISLDLAKLVPVNTYRLIWDSRAQPPTDIIDYADPNEPVIGQGHGADNFSFLFAYPLSSEEIAALTPNKEYASVDWVDPDVILDAPAGTYHPALVAMVRDTLDVITKPDAPKTIEEWRLRHDTARHTASSAIKAAIRNSSAAA